MTTSPDLCTKMDKDGLEWAKSVQGQAWQWIRHRLHEAKLVHNDGLEWVKVCPGRACLTHLRNRAN